MKKTTMSIDTPVVMTIVMVTTTVMMMMTGLKFADSGLHVSPGVPATPDQLYTSLFHRHHHHL